MNRRADAAFPDTVCAVVKQGQPQHSGQLSWWCDGRADAIEEVQRDAQAKAIARRALNQPLADLTGGALYCHHGEVDPSWAADYRPTAAIGQHRCYRPPEGQAQ